MLGKDIFAVRNEEAQESKRKKNERTKIYILGLKIMHAKNKNYVNFNGDRYPVEGISNFFITLFFIMI